MSFKRSLGVPETSFFLFGPRGVGKSTWLRQNVPAKLTIDLLDQRKLLQFLRDPTVLENLVRNFEPGDWIVVDEVQKAPQLLDEIHRLMETYRFRFALTGSSARKLKRGQANLLGGRAITLSMQPLTSCELGEVFDLDRVLQWGGLPLVINQPQIASETLEAFVSTYLKEEVREEGLLRKLEPFIRFLEIAGQLNGQLLNLSNVAREAQVPRSSVGGYFSILEETLLGSFLPSYQPVIRVRETTQKKFYWFDTGVARAAAGLIHDPLDEVWKGAALETWILHEVRTFNLNSKKKRPLFFYRTPAGVEIDLIIETKKKTQSIKPEVICIEIKSATRWDTRWNKAFVIFRTEKKIHCKKQLGVYRGKDILKFTDGTEVLPVEIFLNKLHAGEIF